MELSRDKIKEIINDDWLLMDDCEGNKNCDVVKEMARIALASLEAEPVAWLLSGGGAKNNVSFDSGNAYADPLREVTPLYTAPPAPVSVPAAMEMDDDFDSAFEHGKAVGWNACRASMLQAGNSPVIPDGWIPVSERMPDNGGKSREFYLCFGTYFDGGEPDYIPACFFIHPDNGWSEWEPVEDDCDPSDVIITHWMELPAAPQQEVK